MSINPYHAICLSYYSLQTTTAREVGRDYLNILRIFISRGYGVIICHVTQDKTRQNCYSPAALCILKYKVKGIKHSHTTIHVKGAAMMKVE